MRTAVRLSAIALSVALLSLYTVSCGTNGSFADYGLDASVGEDTVETIEWNPLVSEKEVWVPEKTYSADGFFDADGNLLTDSEESMSVAFIGGSLTDGEITYGEDGVPHSSNIWTDMVLGYFHETFPHRYLRAYNAGICATTSEYGAIRIERCILEYAPDVIFIEYAVNDSGAMREASQAYMENMILQCKKLDKEPVVIFVYNPWPAEKTDPDYQLWEECVGYKNEIADYYGIGTINVYNSLYSTFEYSDGGSFFAFLGQYYNLTTESDGRECYDVHPNNYGYEFYGNTVIAALQNNPQKYFVRMTETETGFENDLYANLNSIRYNHIAPDSGRLSYSGEWNYYNSEERFNQYGTVFGDAAKIPDRSYFEPNNEDGIKQTLEGGAEVSFESSALGIYVQMPYASVGNIADVYVDGECVGQVSCHMNFYGYTGIDYVALPNDGKSHRIVIRTRAVSYMYGVFRFGYIIEAFEGK